MTNQPMLVGGDIHSTWILAQIYSPLIGTASMFGILNRYQIQRTGDTDDRGKKDISVGPIGSSTLRTWSRREVHDAAATIPL